jgi:hypothetical protein
MFYLNSFFISSFTFDILWNYLILFCKIRRPWKIYPKKLSDAKKVEWCWEKNSMMYLYFCYEIC